MFERHRLAREPQNWRRSIVSCSRLHVDRLTIKVTDSRLEVDVGSQSDVRKPGHVGSRQGWRLFGGPHC
jgi:hypothetical protein